MLSKNIRQVLPVVTVFMLCAAFLGAGTVSAKPNTNGVHYKDGADCQTAGETVTCTGTVVGLGNNTVPAHLDLDVVSTVNCTNNGGQLVEVKTHAISSTAVQLTSSSNNLDFSVSKTVEDPTFANAKAAGCPNNNWSFTADSSFSGSFSLYWCQGNSLINALTVMVGSSAPTPKC
jgi:hypothetical protein